METDADEVPQVLKEIEAGDRLPVSKVGPKYGLHMAAGQRWASQGVAQPDGSVVRLEHARVGNLLLTSMAAVRRFIARRTNPELVPHPGITTPHIPAQRQRASQQWARSKATPTANT